MGQYPFDPLPDVDDNGQLESADAIEAPSVVAIKIWGRWFTQHSFEFEMQMEKLNTEKIYERVANQHAILLIRFHIGSKRWQSRIKIS